MDVEYELAKSWALYGFVGLRVLNVEHEQELMKVSPYGGLQGFGFLNLNMQLTNFGRLRGL